MDVIDAGLLRLAERSWLFVLFHKKLYVVVRRTRVIANLWLQLGSLGFGGNSPVFFGRLRPGPLFRLKFLNELHDLSVVYIMLE
jgi:hypothetical protein